MRLDPGHGLVWGAALFWGLALSLAIEALWRSGRWLGAGSGRAAETGGSPDRPALGLLVEELGLTQRQFAGGL